MALGYVGDPLSIASNHLYRFTLPASTMGWECPKCHRIYAPSITECVQCAPPMRGKWTITGPQYIPTTTTLAGLCTNVTGWNGEAPSC